MARTVGDVTVTLSVLDRLIDSEPKNQAETPLTRSQSLRILKAAVRRDLEWLLNTRRNFQDPDEALREVNRSVWVFGLPDFSAYNISLPADQAKLLRQLQTAVQTFEPRLGNVRITPLQPPRSGIQEFRLRIEALLLMDPAPEPISFDTIIELKSGVCRLSGDASAG